MNRILFVTVMVWAITCRVFALTFASLEADARSTAAPPFPFSPWEHGAVGITKEGRTLGVVGNEVCVWSVGPSAFVWSRHISPQPDAAILYRGVRYKLVSTVLLGSDVVLGIIEGRTPTWGAVWKGFRMVTNQVPSGWAPGFGFGSTVEKVEPISVAKAPMAAIAGGPGGVLHPTDTCMSDPRPPSKRWATVTNCQLSFFGLASVEDLRRRGSTFEFDIVGPEFTFRFASGGDTVNPGVWVGDSGGGVFIRSSEGHWHLLGLLRSGGSCRNMSVSGPVVNEASFLRPELWRELGKPGREKSYARYRRYFADVPNDGTVPNPAGAPAGRGTQAQRAGSSKPPAPPP